MKEIIINNIHYLPFILLSILLIFRPNIELKINKFSRVVFFSIYFIPIFLFFFINILKIGNNILFVPFIGSIVFIYIFLLSILGFGYLGVKFFNETNNIVFVFCFGLFFYFFIGGYIELFSLVSKWSNLLVLVFGYLLFVYNQPIINESNMTIFNSLRNYDKYILIFIFSFLLYFVISSLNVYSISDVKCGFNIHDDFQSYLVFPKKLLETGSLSNEYFSNTRANSSWGGKYYLDSFILAFGDFRNIKISDYLAFIVLSISLLINKNKSYIHLAIIILVLCFFQNFLINNSSYYLLSITCLSILLYIYNNTRVDLFTLCILSIPLIILKPNGLLFLFFIFISLLTQKRFFKLLSFKKISATIGMFLFVMFPWLFMNYKSSGTILDPLFGAVNNGKLIFPEITLNISISDLWKELYYTNQSPFTLLIFMLVVFFVYKKILNYRYIILFLSIYIFSFFYLKNIEMIYRYNFPFVIAMFIFIVILSQKNGLLLNYVSISIITLFISVKSLSTFNIYENTANLLKGVKSENTFNDSIYNQYQEINDLVLDDGKSIYYFIDYPFLLDFYKNDIFINDYPGLASPGEGVPYTSSFADISKYFLNHGVRYLIIGTKSNLTCNDKILDFQINYSKERNLGLSLFEKRKYIYKKMLLLDSISTNKLFDNKKIIVIDLLKDPVFKN